MPKPDDLRFAADWLRFYDDGGGKDTARAHAVADWLDSQAESAELREAAKEHGVPVAKLRRAMKHA
jgi:hypothetical protein